MKRAAGLLCFGLAFLLTAAEFDASFLPEVVMKHDGIPVTREQALKILQREFQPTKLTSREELRDRLRHALDDEICRVIVRAKLKEKDIVPSCDAVLAYLREREKNTPKEIAGKLGTPRERWNALANDPDYQLHVALMRYFDAVEPGKLRITPAEIEFFYRSHQNGFLSEGRLDVAFIGVAASTPGAKARIEAAAARLHQGESFDCIAAEYSKDIPETFYEDGRAPAALLRQGALLGVGRTSGILTFPKGYAIVQLRSRGEPRYLPLASVSDFIAETLRGRIAAAELKEILAQALSQHKIEYFF